MAVVISQALRRLEKLERVVASPVLYRPREARPEVGAQLLGVVFCPHCQQPYDLQGDCRIGAAWSATLRCECGCQIEVTTQAVQERDRGGAHGEPGHTP